MSEILGTLFKYLVSLLGIGAVVFVLYQVFGNNKTQTAITDITYVSTATQALYNGQPTFTTLTNTVAINGKLATPTMISGNTLVNPWGGATTIKVNANNASRFDIDTAAVPSEACAKMMTAIPSVVGLKVNGADQVLPVDAGAAVASCNVTAAAGNSLSFTFSR